MLTERMSDNSQQCFPNKMHRLAAQSVADFLFLSSHKDDKVDQIRKLPVASFFEKERFQLLVLPCFAEFISGEGAYFTSRPSIWIYCTLN